ncbi:MAG: hypothetical protein K2I49_01390 [Ureaplasma sp.]|nr:hypothetical protein [Ureaplasma sp.]
MKRTSTSVIAPSEDSNEYDLLIEKLKEKSIEKIDVIAADGSIALNNPIFLIRRDKDALHIC